MTLVLNLCTPRRDFIGKTTEIITEILVIINCVHCLAETTRLIALLLSIHRTNIESIAQKKFLVERGC